MVIMVVKQNMKSGGKNATTMNTSIIALPRLRVRICRLQYIVKAVMICFVFWLVMVFKIYMKVDDVDLVEVQHPMTSSSSSSSSSVITSTATTTIATKSMNNVQTKSTPKKSSSSSNFIKSATWDEVLNRAKQKRDYCQKSDTNFHGFDRRYEVMFGKDNNTLATLPPFGIIDAIEGFHWGEAKGDDKEDTITSNNNHYFYNCQLPPETECSEAQLTAIFMAYNPDRIAKMFNEIRNLLSPSFHNLVKECIVVWNGPREIDESEEGSAMLEFASQNQLRVVYPLKMGFPNDLMNRYHPDVVKVTTKGILYYDDDGPFYSFKAVESGFELWKRHSQAQIGAMSRNIMYNTRQTQERNELYGPEPNDRHFISHCDNLKDSVKYNFYYFANYDANLVLPSGSMLHSNYLCFLWHPVLTEIRSFVLEHPVHPDDITVSTIVSHLAGRAPRVYSRRLKPQDKPVAKQQQQQQRRRLAEAETKKEGMGGICWDCGAGMTDAKKIWADLRSQAINTLIQYFGSINSGSIGWCENSTYFDPKKDGKCQPVMARQGWLPWMKPDGTPKETCP